MIKVEPRAAILSGTRRENTHDFKRKRVSPTASMSVRFSAIVASFEISPSSLRDETKVNGLFQSLCARLPQSRVPLGIDFSLVREEQGNLPFRSERAIGTLWKR